LDTVKLLQNSNGNLRYQLELIILNYTDMKFKSSIFFLVIIFAFVLSCKEKRQDPTRVENANESINESKQKAAERESGWQGERREVGDTASYESRQVDPNGSNPKSDSLVR